VGLLAVAIALVLACQEELEDLVDVMAKAFSFLLPPMAIPMILGLLTRKTSARGAIIGFLAGLTLGLVAYALSFVEGWGHLRSVPYLTWITAVPTAACCWLFSKLLPDPAEKQADVSEWLAGVSGQTEPEQPTATEDARKRAGDDTRTAIRIIGLAAGAMGTVLAIAVLATVPIREGVFSVSVGAVMALGGFAAAASARGPRQPVED